MSLVTVITDDVLSAPGLVKNNHVCVETTSLEMVTGWRRKPEGLCRGEVCVPVREPEALESDGVIDLEVMAKLLGRRSVSAPEIGVIALARDGSDRKNALEGLRAPDFLLRDLDGRPFTFNETSGRKRLIVTFSSWCGCRYDLPGWQALSDELGEDNISIILVAFDDNVEVVRPFTEGISLPVLLDQQHLLSELYAISNVPTVVWIDDKGTIVRPNELAFGTDTFADFTGVSSEPHLNAIRAWVQHDVSPMDAVDARGAIADLSDDEIDARLHFRVGAEARRRGESDVAESHLRIASTLAPMDFSVRRAAMPLLGEDPFGQEFLDLYDEWKESGSPYHGLPLDAADKGTS